MLRFLLSVLLITLSYVAYSSDFCDQYKMSFYFESNSSELQKKDKRMLDSLVLTLKNEFYIEIHGFTDDVGETEANFKLGESRVNSVAKYFKNDNIKIISYGEENPIFPNDNPQNLAKNRRVDLFLIPTYNGRIRISGKQNSSIDIPLSSMSDKSWCDCEFELEEINSDEEAAEKGIPLITKDAIEFSTEGMIRLKPNACFSYNCNDSIVISLPWNAADSVASVAVLKSDNNGFKWEFLNEELKYILANRQILVTIPCEKWNRYWITICGRGLRNENNKLYVPLLERTSNYFEIEPKIFIRRFTDTVYHYSPEDLADSVQFYDIGRNENQEIFYLSDTLNKYKVSPNLTKVPFSKYKKLEFTDTMLLLKSKVEIQFRTHVQGEKIYLNNEIYEVRGDFFDRLFNLTRYEIPLPKSNYYFTINGVRKSQSQLKFKYKKRRNLYKAKVRK
jgi:hypothetical protein